MRRGVAGTRTALALATPPWWFLGLLPVLVLAVNADTMYRWDMEIFDRWARHVRRGSQGPPPAPPGFASGCFVYSIMAPDAFRIFFPLRGQAFTAAVLLGASAMLSVAFGRALLRLAPGGTTHRRRGGTADRHAPRDAPGRRHRPVHDDGAPGLSHPVRGGPGVRDRDLTRPGLSVCLPAYNEEANIAAMVRDVVAVMSPRFSAIEVIVTNDGSRDRTADVLAKLEREYPCVRAIHHPRNLGYGAAVHTALSAASQDLLFLTDADRQFALEEIDRLTPLIDAHDMVIGYRAPRRDSRRRVLLGVVWTTASNGLFGYLARDVDCAFKLVRREVFTRIGPTIRSRGATFSTEWLLRTRRAGYRIAEVPVTHHPRPAGAATGGRLSVALRAFGELVRLRLTG